LPLQPQKKAEVAAQELAAEAARRELETVLGRAAAAAAAGKTEEVERMIQKHGTFREQLTPHLHQAIQAQVQSRAKDAASREEIEALKGMLQTHRRALKPQPLLVKALESLVGETEARVNAEIKIKLLEKQIRAEARQRAAVATSPEEISRLDQWVEEQIGRLPGQNSALASELKSVVTQAQQRLPQPKKSADDAELEAWKHLAKTRSQAKRLADEGDPDEVRKLISANPRFEVQLAPFLKEAVASQVNRLAACADGQADVAAIGELKNTHRGMLEQDAELAAEFEASLRRAKNAVQARVKRKFLAVVLVLAGLGAAAAAIGALLSRHASK
jgi:hypothetical protein